MQPSYYGPALAGSGNRRRSSGSRRQSKAFEFQEQELVDDVSLRIKRALHLLPSEEPEDAQDKDVFAADDPLQAPV
jgi:hypothetical protein